MPAAEEPQTDESTDDTPEEEADEQPEDEGSDGADEPNADDEPEEEQAEDEEKSEAGDKDDGPLTVTVGEEEAPPPADKAAVKWRESRHKIRDLEREVRELRQKTLPAAEKAPELGPRPKLSDPDVGYDSEKLAEKIEGWVADKVKVDKAKAKAAEEAQAAQRDVEQVLTQYRKKAEALNAEDFPAAEARVVEAMAATHRGIIARKAKDPAAVVYALGKHPARLAKLAAIADPLDFFEAMRAFEAGLTVNTRKPKHEPESKINGGGPKGGAAHDKHLERLEKEADRTGDRRPINAYKNKLRLEEQKKK